MIPDDVVEEVRARADIVDIIGEFVPDLKKSGKDYKSKCPFHEDRTPSFYVVPSKGFYKCFGCDESGDVFTFVRKKLGLDFVEAVKYVGGRSGVEVREVSRARQEEDPRRPLFEANAFARDFYTRQLWEGPQGKPARDYLERRGVDRETAERFELGFAVDDWRVLREAAARHAISDDLLLAVGLLTTSEKSPEPYDRFRNRLIFPIETVSARVVAFGGRILGKEAKGAPKYLNSPESEVYHKGQVLYGLGWARHAIRRDEHAVVTEGYMDVVSASSAGVENVVATLGTALTREHALLLKKYTGRVVLLFDSDMAGMKATFRAGDVLLAEGLQPTVVTLPPGEDPDTIARSGGEAALREYLEGAVDLLDRKLQILEEKEYFESINQTRQAVDRLLPTLRAAADPTLRDIYIAKVAERTGIRRETLEEEVAARPAPGPTRAAQPSGVHARPPAPGRSGRGGRRLPELGAERQFVLLLAKDRTWIERAAERVGPEDLVDPAYRVIFQALVESPDLSHPPEWMDAPVAHRFEELLASDEELGHGGRIFDDSVTRILRMSLDRRIEDAEARLVQVGEGDRQDLEEEIHHLRAERQGLGRGWAESTRWLQRQSNDSSDHPDG
jgi:DNA primase